MQGLVSAPLKLITWAFVICILGISFDSLLLMDNTTRFWLLIALVVVAFVLGGAVALKSMTKW
jgi:hypothetical protein